MLYIGSCAGTFYALDKQSGQVRWTYDIHKDGNQTSFHGDPLITEDLVLIGTDGEGTGHVYAFEKTSGNVRWKYAVTRGVPNGLGVPTTIARDGNRVYAVTLGDELICLDLNDGKLRWSFKSEFAGDRFLWSFSPMVASGQVFFGGLDGYVYDLDSSSGRVIWKKNLGAPAATAVLLSGDEILLGLTDNRIVRLDRKTGEVRSQFSTKSRPFWRLVAGNDSILVQFSDGESGGLACLDKTLKREVWSQTFQRPLSSAYPFILKNAVAVGSEDGQLQAFDLGTGRRLWSYKFPRAVRGIGSVGDVLYLGTVTGSVYAWRPDVPAK